MPSSLPTDWVAYRHIPRDDAAPSARFAASYRQALVLSDALKNRHPNLIYTLSADSVLGPLIAALLDTPHLWHFTDKPDNLGHIIENPVRFLEHFSSVLVSSSPAFINRNPLTHAETLIVPTWPTVRAHYAFESHPVPPEIKVDVIVPFYDDPTTLDCLNSLVGNTSPSLGRVLVISDAGRDAELAGRVRAFVHAHADVFEWLENDRNQGFVVSCNRGIRSTTNDVILLNTDTLVSHGWIDKLITAACSAPKIATVTPLSNYASIFSLDQPRTLCNPANVDIVADILERASDPIPLDAPTAHGFCMYIKRAALEDIGLFDETAFGRGNGEENDFSMRARRAGWRNVVAQNAYVFHRGGLSFKDDKKTLMARNLPVVHRRYPEYRHLVAQFRDEDPLRTIRTILPLLLHDRPRLLSCTNITCLIDSPDDPAVSILTDALSAFPDPSHTKDITVFFVSATRGRSSRMSPSLVSRQHMPSGQLRVHKIHLTAHLIPIFSISSLAIAASSDAQHVAETLTAMRLQRPVLIASHTPLATLLPPGNAMTLELSQPTLVASQIDDALRSEHRRTRIAAEGAAIATSLAAVDTCELRIRHTAHELLGQPNPAFYTTFCVRQLCGDPIPPARASLLRLQTIKRYISKASRRLTRHRRTPH